MGSYTTPKEKLRVLFIPFFATSHIQPITEFAIRLAAANDSVEATMAVTPGNVSIVQSMLEGGNHNVKIATYPFPAVDGLPEGVENLGKATTPDESLRIRVASFTEPVMRPAQEALIRAQSPDAIVTDIIFFWNGRIASELGVPSITFSVIGAFSMLAMRHLKEVGIGDHNEVPRFPAPAIRLPRTELPDFLRREDYSFSDLFDSHLANSFGLALNTSSDIEKQYCELLTGQGYVKRAYFVGPVALLRSSSPSPAPAAAAERSYILEWMDSKPENSVVYLSFGSLAQVKDAQLDEIALGLETSGKSFLWVVRGKDDWSPPKGWVERVHDRGFIITTWAPQTAILAHQALGAFVTQCGWNSVLETMAAGVPVLTWPMVYEQFITERLVTEVLGIGERLWPDGAGLRSGVLAEHEVVPGKDVARALTAFMSSGGTGDAARKKVKEVGAKLVASVAEGGASHRDLRRLVDDLMAAKSKGTYHCASSIVTSYQFQIN